MITVRSSCFTLILLILATISLKNATFFTHGSINRCTCSGTQISFEDGTQHCIHVEKSPDASWLSADETCYSQGGHLAHFRSLSAYQKILTIVQKSDLESLLLGYIVANTELNEVAIMCQENEFQGFLLPEIKQQLFVGEPKENERCVFLENADYKLHYGLCNQIEHILCDRPLEKIDYCYAAANCSTTMHTNNPFLTVASPRTTPVMTQSESHLQTITTRNFATVPRSEMVTAPQKPTEENVTSLTRSTSLRFLTTASEKPVQNVTARPIVTLAPEKPVQNVTARPIVTLAPEKPTQNVISNPIVTLRPEKPTQNVISNPIVTLRPEKSTQNVTSDLIVTLRPEKSTQNVTSDLIVTLASSKSIQNSTSNQTLTLTSEKPVVNATNPVVTLATVSKSHKNENSESSSHYDETTTYGENKECKGIKISQWCIPWWIFLIIGLLLLLLVLCCLAWIFHCCCKILVYRCQSKVVTRGLLKTRETQTENTIEDEIKLKYESDSGYYAENESIIKEYIPMPVATAPPDASVVVINDDDECSSNNEKRSATLLVQSEDDCPNPVQQTNTEVFTPTYTEQEGSTPFENEAPPSYKSDSESLRSELLLLTNSEITPPDDNCKRDIIKPRNFKKKRTATPQLDKTLRETPFTESDISRVSRHFTPPPFRSPSYEESSLTSRSMSKDYKPRKNRVGASRAVYKSAMGGRYTPNSGASSSLSNNVRMRDPQGIHGGIAGTGRTSASPVRWMQWSNSSKPFSDHPNAFLSNDI